MTEEMTPNEAALDKTEQEAEHEKSLKLKASAAMLPEYCALTAAENLWDELDMVSLVNLMKHQVDEIQSGDNDKIERHLYSQGVALNALFVRMIKKFTNTSSLHEIQLYGQLALKAQAQARVTFTAVADLRNPNRATFIKQQNNAINQQVNNQLSTEQGKDQPFANEILSLSEATKYETVDTRGTQQASTADPAMAPLDPYKRA